LKTEMNRGSYERLA